MNCGELAKQSVNPPRRGAWIYATLLWIAAIGVSCLFFDHAVSGWFHGHPSHWHENGWVNGFRQLGKASVPIWLAVIWSLLTDQWRPTVVTMAAMILVGASVCPLKALVRRSRPHDALTIASREPSEPALSWQKKVSFPSGDTAVAFAAATSLSYFLGSLWTPALFVAAGAVGLLRITILAHYPSDVLAGALIGVFCGMCAFRWARGWPLDQFRVRGRWRLLVAPVLLLGVPLLSPFIDHRSLLTFLKVYAIPLTVLILVYLAAVQVRARKPESKRIET